MLDVRRRKVWKSMITLGLVAAVAAILVLSAGVASAKGKPPKPPKEEPQDPNPDTGVIYYNFSSTIWSMASDGSNRQSLGLIAAYHVDASEFTRDGERWFLTVDTVDGTYPNGYPRWEIFAVSESGTRVQLTDAPDVETLGAWPENSSGDWRHWFVYYGARPAWFCDDTKVSYWARRWQDGAVVEGSDGLYEVDVDLSTTSPDTTPTKLELNLGPLWELGGPRYSWSPDDSQLVYSEGGPVYVVSAPGGTPSQITSGAWPQWSPDGMRILVQDGGDVYSVATDGSDRTLVVGRGDSKKEDLVGVATWSPNATHVAYTVKKNIGQTGMNVYRANVQGEYETDLTEDLTYAVVIAWRAE